MSYIRSIHEQYQRQGYVAPVRVMAEEEAVGYRKGLEDSERKLGRPLTYVEKDKPYLVYEWAWNLVRHPAVLDAVETITGPNILVWDASFLNKEPGGKEHLTWHQDLRYWGLDPGDQVVTAWIALSHSNREMGCMRVVRGTNKSGLKDHQDTYSEGNLLSRGQKVKMEVNEADVVDIVLRPGEMSLHDVYIIHGSEPNRTNERRIGFVVRYFATSTKQKAKLRDSALLVRGVDDYGHFDLEQAPDQFESEAAFAWQQEVFRRRRELQGTL